MKRNRTRAIVAALLVACGIAFWPVISRADRVAPLHAHGGTDADRASIDRALHVALAALGHTSPTDEEILQGEGAAGDYENQSAGLVAIGKTTSSEWVVDASLVSTKPERVEVKVCQVATGRVETLARDLDPKRDVASQLREMLAIMLRPQGIGDEPLPWESGSGSAPAASASASASTDLGSGSGSGTGTGWGREHAFAIGVSGGGFDLVARAEGVQGSRTVGAASLVAGWTIASGASIVDLFARVGGLFGPGPALRAETGGRAFARLSPSVAIGGAATAGVFAETAGNKVTRPLLGVAAVLAIAFSPRIQLDLDLASLRVAPGSGGALVFLGAEAAIVARF